jgi:pilus assembly protein CpaB
MFELDNSGKNVTQISLTGDTKYTSITIEATPREAQDLIYLMSASPGNLYMTLRNPNDRKTPPRMPSSNADTIMGRVGIPSDAVPVAGQNQGGPGR